MKPFLTFLLCFSTLCARAFAQVPADDPKEGTLIDCGGEKIVVFGHTESRDSRYALGWTIRPNAASAKPVDWTAYKKDDPFGWLGEHKLPADATDPGSYDLVDGVIDLHDGKFTLLVTGHPLFPAFESS